MCCSIAVSVKNISKCYQIYDDPKDRLWQPFGRKLSSLLGKKPKQYYREHWALRDISFDVERGDALGILGKNGAGKSTLLQLLTGTLTPTSGDIDVHGRVAALLELGAGFNPDFTGRENIYMNAAILGLSKAEIEKKYSQIVEFSGIENFIDQPVSTYSSGMYIRLAFSVAAHIEPDILIIDEALAVGDMRFQMKCLRHLESLKSSGTTILFVSHAPEQVKRFCNKAIWLHDGSVRASGASTEVSDVYREYMLLGEIDGTLSEHSNDSQKNAPARLMDSSLDRHTLNPGDPVKLTINYQVLDEHVEGLLIGAAIYTADRKYVFGPNTYLEKIVIPSSKGNHCIQCCIPELPLLPGSFSFDVGLFSEKGLVTLDYLSSVEQFQIFDEYRSEGIVYIKHEWKIIE